jgi:aminopeptidase YwaD
VNTGFAFMVSPSGAAGLRKQLASGQTVTLGAHVDAKVIPSHWTVVTATIPGTDPKAGEVVYSCHLDHQRPGANDNASGCVTILEAARVLAHLIASKQLPRPARTLRFVWGPEVEGTMAFLSKHPEIRHALRADIHMDMVGGDPYKNKSILHVTATPWSLPTFITDVGDLLAETLHDDATVYTEDGSHAREAVIEERDGAGGTRNAFLVDETPYAEGSDHDDYDSSAIAVPSLYLRDWPDIYIHTNHDTLDQIDPTKLRRVAVLGAAAGYIYASLDAKQADALLPFFAARSQRRLAAGFERAMRLTLSSDLTPADAWYEGRNLLTQTLVREHATLTSLSVFTTSKPLQLENQMQALERQAASYAATLDAEAKGRGAADPAPVAPWQSLRAAGAIPRRLDAENAFGPLTYQNDDVLRDRLGAERVAKIRLLGGGSSRLLHVQDSGALYAYEAFNLVDGKRSVGQIRDVVSAEFGPVPFEFIEEFLQACAEAKLITIT